MQMNLNLNSHKRIHPIVTLLNHTPAKARLVTKLNLKFLFLTKFTYSLASNMVDRFVAQVSVLIS